VSYGVRLSCNPFPLGIVVMPSEFGTGAANVSVVPPALYFNSDGSWNASQLVTVLGGWDDAVVAGGGGGVTSSATLQFFVHRPVDGYGGWDAAAVVTIVALGM
jgi:hypothetical protein